jgi:hypothetical protein
MSASATIVGSEDLDIGDRARVFALALLVVIAAELIGSFTIQAGPGPSFCCRCFGRSCWVVQSALRGAIFQMLSRWRRVRVSAGLRRLAAKCTTPRSSSPDAQEWRVLKCPVPNWRTRYDSNVWQPSPSEGKRLG